MACGSLNHRISFVHGRLDAVIQDQLDGTLQDNSKVHALRPVHDVHLVRHFAGGGEIDDTTHHPRGVDQADFLAMHLDKGTLSIGRYPVSLVEIGEAWEDARWGSALGINWARWSQDLIAAEDSLAFGIVSWDT